MSNKIDITNKRFGKLIAIEDVGRSKDGKVLWLCKCDCGNIVTVIGKNLRNGNTRSCGCYHKLNLVGKRFGRLYVVSRADVDKWGRPAFVCRCDCGNEVIVSGNSLNRGFTKSCGCLQRELISNRAKKHGMRSTKFYKIYIGILDRCNNKNSTSYHNYGARGIKCLWSSFEEFRDDMYESYLDHIEKHGEKNTLIDRIDVNGNYSKENCRWATWEEQANNRTTNKYIKVDGEVLTVAQAAKKFGIIYETAQTRLRSGKNIFGLHEGKVK